MGKHLKFDTDFLNSVKPSAPKSDVSRKPNWVDGGTNGSGTPTAGTYIRPKKKTHYARYALISLGLFIGLMVWVSSLNSTGTPSTGQPSGDNQVQLGQYWCSNSDYNQAIKLKVTEQERSALDVEEAWITSTGNALDAEYLDKSNSYAVDNYNYRIKAYNSRLNKYKVNLEAFNARVDTYNNYLDTHCTKR